MSEQVESKKQGILRHGKPGPCSIWPSGDEVSAHSLRDAQTSSSCNYSPRAGGVFRLDDLAVTTHLSNADEQLRAKISRWIFDQNELGRVGFITGEEIDRIANQPPLRIEQRIARLLECFHSLPDQVSTGLWISGTQIPGAYDCLNLVLAATECVNQTDRLWLVRAAFENGWLESHKTTGGTYNRLTPAGVAHLESLAVQTARSDQAFVAMWFASEMQEVFDNAIEPALLDAGYRAYKVDLDQNFDHQITDKIFIEIERSRFLVADFTHDNDGARGGVYFEAGYAKGLGLPIIWCVRDDGVSKMHFDTDHYPHIIWKEAADLKEKLTAKILAFVGRGPLRARSNYPSNGAQEKDTALREK